ncbi:hypothetical protein [Flavobacterium sp. MK4S-17]|uniref:hypothetical protein n=1 Tax=Flavobacterium sp. MK4S-17 TaxID=2543737 RepID=UPI00135C68DE|nr:hypothetical protein [Flavobacterium sp. MK4S-17]
MKLKLYPRQYALLSFSFIAFTIIGTISHELGHAFIAKYLVGYEVNVSYASINYKVTELDEYTARYNRDKKYIEAETDSHQKNSFLEYRNNIGEQISKNRFYILLGGPIQTTITGTIGILLLWFNRKKILKNKYLNFFEWLAVFFSFFWSRQVFNFLIFISQTIIGAQNFHNDEFKISNYLNLSDWLVGFITFLIGLILLFWVTFVIIPANIRLTFIFLGITGSTLGWIIWMHWLGPNLLP